MRKSFIVLFLALILVSSMAFQLRMRGGKDDTDDTTEHHDDKDKDKEDDKDDSGNMTSKWLIYASF